jgi:hypothetical protein
MNTSIPNESKYDLDNVFIQILNRIELLNERNITFYSESLLMQDAKYMVKILQKLQNFLMGERNLGFLDINGNLRHKNDLIMVQYIEFFDQLLKNLRPNDKINGRPDVNENLTQFTSIYRSIITILSEMKSKNSNLWNETILNGEYFTLI